MAGLHTLTRTTKRKAARVGRGGKRGKTAGRGMKGQKARAGGTPRPELRDAIKKLPKRRGYGKNRARTVYTLRDKPVAVSLAALERAFAAGEKVSPQILVDKKVVVARGGKVPAIKILANGEITKKLSIEKCLASETAMAAITKAGGSLEKTS